MTHNKERLKSLKFILEHASTPEALNNHPWTQSLLVREALAEDPTLAERNPGQQLLLVIADLFRALLPASPPKSGKRLDTRWGRFGLLAANYFAPLLYGRLYPRSLRDAWRRIDPALLLFVYGEPSGELSIEKSRPYALIDGELDLPANSTISDWHRGGLEELTEFFLTREAHLSRRYQEPSPVLENQTAIKKKKPADRKSSSRSKKGLWRWIALALGLLLLVGITAAGIQARQIYDLATALQKDISAIQEINSATFDPAQLDEIGQLLTRTREDLAALQAEVEPWSGLTSRLGWLPTYGGEIQYANDLLGMAASTLESVDIVYQSALPIWEAFSAEDQQIKATDLTRLFLDTKPALLEAQAELHQARALREGIDDEELSLKTREILTRVDPYLSLLDQGLSLSLSLPGLLGGAADGPKTYLILIQNEDELRPTGGFITSVAKVLVFEGKLVSWEVEDSYGVDKHEELYPPAPWQLRSFMNLPVMTFKDTNWFSDYPKAARWAEYLYAFSNSQSVDGVFAIDQHVLVSLLELTGPVYIPEIEKAVSSENILEIMRAQKIPPSKEDRDPEWHRKQFMKPIASAVLDKLLSGKGFSWKKALGSIVTLLDERHILLQLDDPVLTEVLVERNWDGAVRNPGGDFLLLVDSNVGINKANAVLDGRFSYDLDLTDLSAPVSSLVVFHKNYAQGEMGEFCSQRPRRDPEKRFDVAKWYPIDRCYYNYLRVYLPADAILLDASPHAVTREDMIYLDQDIPARVDILDEKIEDVSAFGTLLFVRMGASLETGFRFKLPASILQPGPDPRTLIYRLKIQKQAGIISAPVTLRVHLPNGAKVQSVSPEGIQEGENILFNLELREDIEVEIIFTP